MKITITTLIAYDESGVTHVIHSLHDDPKRAEQEIVNIYNGEEGTDLNSLNEIKQFHEKYRGTGTHISIQELKVNGNAICELIQE